MKFSNAAWVDAEQSSLLVDCDGRRINVPADPSNKDFAEIMAAAISIAPFEKVLTESDVAAERARRLAIGFDYDFGDARGVHQIGTTPNDMIGWREVIDYANALIDSGDTTTKIAIVTDTGPAEVTAPEWQAIMLVAASVRQNIWAKSFALQAMQPIPGDYANDSYWSQ